MLTSKDERILVAGGTGNVGRHVVRTLLSLEATVIVPSRDPARLEALEAGLDPGLRHRLIPLVGDIGDEVDARRLAAAARPLDGAVASLGRFERVSSLLEAPLEALDRVVDDYLVAHFVAARALIPELRERGGGYVMINGPLAFQPFSPPAALVSVVTAAQAMLARTLSHEMAGAPVRVNELVIYSGFGWGTEDRNLLTGEDIGRYVAYLLSDEGAAVRGESLHLRTPEAIPAQVRPSTPERRHRTHACC